VTNPPKEDNPVGQGWHRPQKKCLSAPSRGVTEEPEQKLPRKEKQETNILGVSKQKAYSFRERL